MPRLILKNRVLADVALPVRGALALVGRGPEAHVRIDHPSVSRVHARLEAVAGAWTVHDLDSRNGTWVNDERAVGATPLANGDRLKFGESEAVFDDADAAEAPAPRARRAAAAAVSVTYAVPERRVDTTPSVATTTLPATNGAADEAGARGAAKRRALPWIVGLLAIVGLAVGAFFALRTPPPADAAEATGPRPYRDALDDPAFVAAADAAAAAARTGRPAPAAAPAEPRGETPRDAVAPPADVAADGMMVDAASRSTAEEPERRGAPHGDGMTAADEPTMEGADVAMDGISAPPKPVPTPTESPPAVVVDPPTTPPPPPADPARPRRVPTLDERFRFRRLAYDLWGRPPTEDELAEFAAAGREATVDRLLGSRERWEAWYEDELYDLLLIDEFRPGADRLDDLPGRLADGRTNVRDALAEIAKSQQFNARNPGNDTYVTVVFEQFLGITVQSEKALLEEGKRMYDGRAATIFGKRGRSQADFVDIALAEPRFAATYRRPACDGPPRRGAAAGRLGTVDARRARGPGALRRRRARDPLVRRVDEGARRRAQKVRPPFRDGPVARPPAPRADVSGAAEPAERLAGAHRPGGPPQPRHRRDAQLRGGRRAEEGRDGSRRVDPRTLRAALGAAADPERTVGVPLRVEEPRLPPDHRAACAADVRGVRSLLTAPRPTPRRRRP
jgi:hypothetical protein